MLVIRLVKKWWLLQEFHKDEKFHSLKLPLDDLAKGMRVSMSPKFFLVGNDEYPGVVKRSLTRFSSVMRWRKDGDKSQEALRKKTEEFNNIIASCLKEDYLKMTKSDKGLKMLDKGKNFDKVFGWDGLIEMIWGNTGATVKIIVGITYWTVLFLTGLFAGLKL